MSEFQAKYRQLDKDDEKLLREYGFSAAVLQMLCALGARHSRTIRDPHALAVKLRAHGFSDVERFVSFQHALGGIRFAMPWMTPESGANRVFGAEFGLLSNGKLHRADVHVGKKAIRCGNIYCAPDDLWMSDVGAIFYGGLKIADSIRPFMEGQAFDFLHAERWPVARRYFMAAEDARAAVVRAAGALDCWKDIEPGYGFGICELGAVRLSKFWGAPDEDWEVRVYSDFSDDFKHIVDVVESFPSFHIYKTVYSAEDGWRNPDIKREDEDV